MGQPRQYAAISFLALLAVLCGEMANAEKPNECTVARGSNGGCEQPGARLGLWSSKAGNDAEWPRRSLSERDAITMRLVSGPGASSNYGATLTQDFAAFSPDGSKVLITLKRGNLRNNTTEYSLLLYRTDELFRSPKPVVLVSMSSSSNREAIKDVSWLQDNNTVLFLGEHPGERTQLYSIWCPTRTLRRLSSHPTNLVTYSADSLGHTIVYAAEKVVKCVLNGNTLRHGFWVTDQSMADLIAGEIQDDERELYVWRKRGGVRPLSVPPNLEGKLWGQSGEIRLSPDGRQLVVKINLTTVPENWRQYRDTWVHRGVVQYRPSGAPSWIFRYGIINVENGRARPLLDSPVGYSGSEVTWSKDSHFVVLSGVYRPLRCDGPALETLETKIFVVEVEVDTLRYSTITDESLKPLGWGKRGKSLVFETQPEGEGARPGRACFQKRDGVWTKVEVGSGEHEQPPVITTEQDLNTPPRIVALDPASGRKKVLLDLNPQLRDLDLGRVEDVTFRGAGSREVHAGLYFPPDYLAGRQYPLVIQTHGFDPSSFWIDGPYPTAFAAQALASTGILVLQLPSSHAWVGTQDEAPKMMETFSAAIQCVQSRGIVDKDRIGIIGFSRTGFHVAYALTHQGLHFAAAVVADGSDGGYSQYLQFLNASPYTAADSEAINGGLPFGPGIASWLQRSPEFALDQVHAPLLIQALNPRSLSFAWGTFVALKRLGKPVDLLYLPNAQHILQKPWDRLASQEGVVDWFAFWFLGREDPDPAKSAQYVRWRTLRELQSNKSSSNDRAGPVLSFGSQ